MLSVHASFAACVQTGSHQTYCSLVSACELATNEPSKPVLQATYLLKSLK